MMILDSGLLFGLFCWPRQSDNDYGK